MFKTHGRLPQRIPKVPRTQRKIAEKKEKEQLNRVERKEYQQTKRLVGRGKTANAPVAISNRRLNGTTSMVMRNESRGERFPRRVRRGKPRGRRSRRRRGRGTSTGDTQILQGTDYGDTVVVSDGNAIGDIIDTWTVAPNLISGSRSSKMAALYDKYELIYFKVEYVTASPTNQGGQMILFYEPDPQEQNASDPSLIRKASSAKGQQTFSSWEGTKNDRVICTARPTPGDQDRYISDDGSGRLTSFGKIYLVNNWTWNTLTTIGTIRIHYKYRFYSPILEDGYVDDFYFSRFTMNGTVSKTSLLGTDEWTKNPKNNIPGRRLSAMTFELDSGYYYFILSTTGTGFSGGTNLVTMSTAYTAGAVDTFAATTTACVATMSLEVQPGGKIISLLCGTATTADAFSIKVTRYWNTNLLKQVAVKDELADLKKQLKEMREMLEYQNKNKDECEEIVVIKGRTTPKIVSQ